MIVMMKRAALAHHVVWVALVSSLMMLVARRVLRDRETKVTISITTVSSTIVSREKSRFSPLYYSFTRSRCEKYGVFENTELLVEKYCRNSSKGNV